MRKLPLHLVLTVLLLAVSVPLTFGPSTASAALPEFYRHGAPVGAGAVIPFRYLIAAPAVTAVLRDRTYGPTVTCYGSEYEGDLHGPTKVNNVRLEFYGCETEFAFIRFKCNTPGFAAGRITSEYLKGQLIYLHSAATPVGMLLEPESGEVFLRYECTGLELYGVKGHLIGEVGGINAESETWELFFREAGGKQEWSQIEEVGAANELFVPEGVNQEIHYYVLTSSEKVHWGAKEGCGTKVEIKG